jgi:trigger factor
MNSATSANTFNIPGLEGKLSCNIKELGSENLSRSFSIHLPQEHCAQVMDFVTHQISKTAKIKGFRPGKVPVHFVKMQYAHEIISEARELLIKHSSFVVTKNFKIYGEIDVNIKEFKENSDFDYEITFEIFPEIKLPDLTKIHLTQLICEPTSQNIEEAKQGLAKNFRDSEPSKSGTQAKEGDIIVIDFVGKLDGVAFEGGSSQGYNLELGSKSFIVGFEEQLIGSKAGDQKLIKVTFPADYHNRDYAGREAEFDIKVSEVRHTKPHPIDDELARKCGTENIEKLDQEITSALKESYATSANEILKKELFDALNKECSFECPKAMLQAEIYAIKTQFNEAELKDTQKINEIALRRVRLGLLLSNIASDAKLEITPQDLQRELLKLSKKYPGQESELIQWYSKNPKALATLNGPAMEEKAVAFILSKVKIKEKNISIDELTKIVQGLNESAKSA